MVSKLELIDPHQAFVLLKNSMAIPKLTYLLRSSPAYKEADLLQEFDEIVRTSLSQITNVDVKDKAWTQASFPARMGGLGIRKSEDIALPAYISSSISTQSLVESFFSSVTDLVPPEISPEIETWRTSAEGLLEPQGELRSKQRAWDAPRMEILQKELIKNADQFSRARLQAAAQPESGAWASAIPVPSLGTQLSPEEIRIATATRIGAKVCEIHPCNQKCNKNVDEYGFHALSCRYSEGRRPRHTAINDIVWRALRSAGMEATLEPKGVNRGDGLTPDGLTTYPFSQGKALCWDATCVNTYNETSVMECAMEAGSAAKKKRK